MNLEGIRVLLVEDNPGDVRLFLELLSETGAGHVKVDHVDRLATALERLSNQTFDVVLLDLSLPDAHGLDTLVRAHAHAPSGPIVVLTGLDDQALAVKAVRAGAQDYLVKGRVDGDLLVRSMRYATERARALEALERREEHYRSLIENSLDLISILNVDGTIRYASPSHERVLDMGWKRWSDRMLSLSSMPTILKRSGPRSRAPMARPRFRAGSGTKTAPGACSNRSDAI